jgi:hypothetical protein
MNLQTLAKPEFKGQKHAEPELLAEIEHYFHLLNKSTKTT